MTGYGSNAIEAEIGDLSSEVTTCLGVSSYPITDNFGAVGTFVNDRGLICGGHNGYNSTLESFTSTSRCFSWNAEVCINIKVLNIVEYNGIFTM